MIRTFTIAGVIAILLAGCNKDAPPTTVLKTVNADGTATCVILDPNNDHTRDMKLPHCYPDGMPAGWVTQTETAAPTP